MVCNSNHAKNRDSTYIMIPYHRRIYMYCTIAEMMADATTRTRRPARRDDPSVLIHGYGLKYRTARNTVSTHH